MLLFLIDGEIINLSNMSYAFRTLNYARSSVILVVFNAMNNDDRLETSVGFGSSEERDEAYNELLLLLGLKDK